MFFFSSRRRHTRLQGDWSSDVCSSDLKGSEFYAKSKPLPSQIYREISPSFRGARAYAARAFSTSLAIRHALVLEIGRHSSIMTKSPSPHSFFSSWAWYFFERVTIFPYIGWVTRRSTNTVTVLSILSLTTRPVSVRVVLASLISLPPFP